ncbi:hypothetical protein PR048_011792 [Dryococelus australis]|uniref:Uncharacterized protein n=1 Tax=Dryococelus australis TaxID=614101 RepID=A0ABQ9HN79_9NEOP|nr:hypothetical protein PR048_011792 [Dryococelus australis]
MADTEKHTCQKKKDPSRKQQRLSDIKQCLVRWQKTTSFDLRCVVKSYLDGTGSTVTCFHNNFPGCDWAESFMKRHRNVISQQTAKNISYSRAATGKEVLQGVPAANVWNYAETILVDPGNKKFLIKRGTKHLEQLHNASKACTSLMVCGNAESILESLYVNYKTNKLWSTGQNQAGLITNHLKADGVKVITGGNLRSHVNRHAEVAHLCEVNSIKFVALPPPNSTHLLHSLDVLEEWKRSAYGSKCSAIPKDQFPRLLKCLMDAITHSQSNLKAGFQEDRDITFRQDSIPRYTTCSYPKTTRPSIASSDIGGGVHATTSIACGHVKKQCRSCEDTPRGQLPVDIHEGEEFTVHYTVDSMDTNYFH